MKISRSVAVIGVPSSAGAFGPGQEKAPAAFRAAGLLERLAGNGADVADYGDSPLWRWRPDPVHPAAMNADAVLAAALAAAERVRRARESGRIALVLGGDCTVELGTVAGHLGASTNIGLIYVDLHPDLNVPSSILTGTLDWMGMAHLLGDPDALPRLSQLGSRFPMLKPDNVYLFAYDPRFSTEWEIDLISRRRLNGAMIDAVASDPEMEAMRARAALEAKVDALLVHFDVDTVDFSDLPLSENTENDAGLSFHAAMRALRVLLASPKLSAVTVTEVNPDHGDSAGEAMTRLTAGLADVLTTQLP